MRNKMVFVLLLLIYSVNHNLMAQNAKPLTVQNAHEFAKLNVDSLTVKLNLTNKQAADFFNLEKLFLESRAAIPAQISFNERAKIIKEQEAQREDQLKKILNTEQYRLYRKLLEERIQYVNEKRKKLQEQNKPKT